MSGQRWYIDEGGQEVGPLTPRELKAMVQSGRIVAETRLRLDGAASVVPARRVKGLLPAPLLTTVSLPAVPVRGLPTLPASFAPAADNGEDASLVVPVPTRSAVLDPAGTPESLFENVGEGSAPKVRRAVVPSRLERAARAVVEEAPAGVPLSMPRWSDLWPLAVLSLLLGWIGGGFFCANRMYLPGAASPVLVLALGGVPFAFAAIIHYLRPSRIPLRTAIAVSVFTAVGGIIMLLLLQVLAGMAAHGIHVWHGRAAVVWAVLAAIGTAYDWTTSANIVLRWIGFVFGVGLCEETTKLLPLVALILWRRDRLFSVHAFLLLGFASGIGFGIGEALYGYAPWRGNYGAGSNIIRWYSAIPSHAVYTTVCAAFLWKLADRLEYAEGFWGRAGVVAMAAGAMAVVHGTYDTVCSLGITISVVMEALSFGLLIWAVRWVSVGAREPAVQGPPTTWAATLGHRLPMAIGAGGALAMLVIALALSSSREQALPAILSASLPAAYRPYIL